MKRVITILVPLLLIATGSLKAQVDTPSDKLSSGIQTSGIVKIVSGTLGTAVTQIVNGRNYLWNWDQGWENGALKTPAVFAAENAFIGVALGGVADCIISSAALRGRVPMGKGESIAWLSSGAVAFACGAGLITYACIEADSKDVWVRKTDPATQERKFMRLSPSGALPYCFIGGAFLVSAGISAMCIGGNQLVLRHRADGSAAASLSFAPLPAGAALSLRF